MDLWYYVLMPFTLLLKFFYLCFNSYGVALLLFALVVKLILFPLSIKGKKSMIQMNMLSSTLNRLQKQYKNNPSKYNEEVQKLYAKEGVSPMGGCLWSMLPLCILIPLYAIIRQPLKYMMGLTYEQMVTLGNTVLNWSQVAFEQGWIKEMAELTDSVVKAGYNQLYLTSLITPENLEAVKAAVASRADAIFSIDFSFLGVNLAAKPELMFWKNGLAGLGLFLIPVISGVTSIFFSLISMKTNSMNGEVNDQTAKTTRTMMFITPIMSLWIGFSMPAALSIYWIANNLLGLLQEWVSSKMLKRDYEQAAEAKRLQEIEEKEEEKRLRREKAEAKARAAEEARKNKGKKKEKDPDEVKMTPQQREASRVGIRQYARGRAYDPDRFGGVTAYHEDLIKSTIREVESGEEKPVAAPVEQPAPEEPVTTVPMEETAVETTLAAPEAETPTEETVEEDMDRLNAELDAAIQGGEDQDKTED